MSHGFSLRKKISKFFSCSVLSNLFFSHLSVLYQVWTGTGVSAVHISFGKGMKQHPSEAP